MVGTVTITLAILGQPPVRLAVGAAADLVLFDLPENEPLKVIATIKAGQVTHGRLDNLSPTD